MAKKQNNLKEIRKYRNQTMIMPFGQYQGRHLRDIPDDYIRWGISNFSDKFMRDRFRNELEWRSWRQDRTIVSESPGLRLDDLPLQRFEQLDK